jgi:hypothetical protein
MLEPPLAELSRAEPSRGNTNATTMSYVGRSEPPEPLESPAAIEIRKFNPSEMLSLTNSLRPSEHYRFRLTNGPFSTVKREIPSMLLVVHSSLFLIG